MIKNSFYNEADELDREQLDKASGGYSYYENDEPDFPKFPSEGFPFPQGPTRREPIIRPKCPKCGAPVAITYGRPNKCMNCGEDLSKEN